MSRLSVKQITAIASCDARINLLMGAVRSGKTFSSIIILMDLIQNGPPGDCMIVGVSRGTIQRNVLEDMFKLWGWPAPPEGKNKMKIYGRNVYFIGAKDERAVSVIYGATLAIAYIDEVPKIPQSVFKTLLDRCSVKDAKIIGTGNPEGPRHWLKTEYLENKTLDLQEFKFFLSDNPSLDQTYIKNLKKENTGVWYKRLILGEWAAAEGMIYDCLTDDNFFEGPHLTPPYYIAGIDYGTSNATACVIAAIYPKQFPKIRIVKEYYYDAKKSGRCKTDSEYGQDILNFLKPYSNLKHIYVDPSALSFRTELERLDLPVQEANNDVLSGIKTVSGFIYNKQLAINRTCTNLIDSLYSYTWDDKASKKGEDAPKKEFDHASDAARYMIFSHFPNGEIANERETWSAEKWKREMTNYDPMTAIQGGMYI
jgi:PBSX family phage terminase large subunit